MTIKATKKSKTGNAHKEILIVGSKMKDVVKQAGFMSSSDLIEALSERVRIMLIDASKRANSNDRRTVRPCDL